MRTPLRGGTSSPVVHVRPQQDPAPAHIVLHTFGSLGDLHPYLALGLADRGHRVTVATSSSYRQRVERLGFEFHPVQPEFDPGDPALLKRVMNPRSGTEFVMNQLYFPGLREGFKDLAAICEGKDMLISSPIGYAAILVAATSGIPWLSTALAPISFFSRHDPPLLIPELLGVKPLHGLNRVAILVGRLLARSWAAPYRQLRSELGMAPAANPIFEGIFSPRGVLALFSPQLAAPQSDWPPETRIAGFLYHDGAEPDEGLSAELEHFLGAGAPPLVFTLGSAAVEVAGDFYRQSLAAAQRLGHRAVLVVGRGGLGRLPEDLPEGVLAVEYAPYSALFPRAAAIVHQGGIGTTARALRAGKPMLVVPFAQDQFDNAAHVRRLGVGLALRSRRYRGDRAVRWLARLLEDEAIGKRAAALGERVAAEDGLGRALDQIEAELVAG